MFITVVSISLFGEVSFSHSQNRQKIDEEIRQEKMVSNHSFPRQKSPKVSHNCVLL